MKAYCSYTAQPNTPETDAMELVPHIVQVRIAGGEEKVLVRAREPGEAISIVNHMTEAQYQGLTRVG